MPRSKVRPNVSTYHEAVNLILVTLGVDDLPITKKGDKFTTAALRYIAGYLELGFKATIQDIWAELKVSYHIPDQFLTSVRVMQQNEAGISTPACYGTSQDAANFLTRVIKRIETTVGSGDGGESEELEPGNISPEQVDQEYTHPEEHHPEDSVPEESHPEPQPTFAELAAANPLAVAFLRALESEADQGYGFYAEEDQGEDWEYQYDFDLEPGGEE
jgi:hypothetical protein